MTDRLSPSALRYALFLWALVLIAQTTSASSILEVAIPEGSSKSVVSHPVVDNVWAVTTITPVDHNPLDITTGIGWLLNPLPQDSADPTNPNDFTLHDSIYLSPSIPDPTRAVVTYKFDAPTIIHAIQIIQHHNGITQLEGFFGDDLANMTSLGSVFGPSGDVTGFSQLPNGGSQIFNFNNTTHAGVYFQFIVRKVSTESIGWAAFRAFPLDLTLTPIPTPEPTTFTLLTIPSSLLLLRRRSSK